MDGSKKIIKLCSVLILTLISVACKVNQPAYVSLYVGSDYEIGLSDSLNIEVSPARVDPLKLQEVIAIKTDNLTIRDTLQQLPGIDAVSTVITATVDMKAQSAEAAGTRDEKSELLKAQNDSILMRINQLTALQQQKSYIPDTVFVTQRDMKTQQVDAAGTSDEKSELLKAQNDSILMRINQLTALQQQKSYIPDTVIAATVVMMPQQAEAAGTRDEKSELLKAQNDSILMRINQLTALQQQKSYIPDTVFVTQRDMKTQQVDAAGTSDEKSELLKAQNDSILMRINQLTALQQQKSYIPDTVFVTQRDMKTQQVDAAGTSDEKSELLKAQNDSILMLINQLTALQKQKSITPDTVFVTNDPDKILQNDSIASGYETTKMLLAQNDSILMLQNQLIALQKQKNTASDTVYLPKEIILPSTLEDKSEIQPEVDTITINAYYEKGEIKPLKIDTVIQQLRQINANSFIVSLSLTGQTDISGNAEINKRLTNLRLNYMIERISTIISSEKIFVQNMGSKFASKTIVDKERKIEIRVLTK